MQHPIHDPDRATITPDEYAALFGVSRYQTYVRLRAGDLPHIRIGNRYFIPAQPLRDALGIRAAS